jgi:hypothetical protein
MLKNGKKSIGVATISVDSDKRFQLTVRVTENHSQYSATEDGELVSGCSKE